MKPVILIPTYNESVAIVELLQQLSTLHNARDFDVIVLDDNSPDKTADIVDNLHHDWVRVLRRPGKAGLGAAYRAGFDRVLELSKYSHVITMDADGSHRVEDLPAMMSPVQCLGFSQSLPLFVLCRRQTLDGGDKSN